MRSRSPSSSPIPHTTTIIKETYEDLTEYKTEINPAKDNIDADVDRQREPNPDVVNYDDYNAFLALAAIDRINVTVKMSIDDYKTLKIGQKEHFHAFLQHCTDANKGLNDLLPDQDAIKKNLKLANAAYKKLNVNPVAAACFAVLSAVAAAAAAVFLWPAAVVASLGITAMYVGVAAAAVSGGAAVTCGLFAAGAVKNKHFNDLKAVENKLEEANRPAPRP